MTTTANNQMSEAEVGRAGSESDIRLGLQRGEELFGTTKELAGISKGILGERRERLARGISPEERQRIRREGRGAVRETRAAAGRAGVRGGTALAAEQAVGTQTAELLQQADARARERGLETLARDVGKRQFGVQSAVLGQQQLGLSERASIRGVNIASQPPPASSGGISVICTELYRQKLLTPTEYMVENIYGLNLLNSNPNLYWGYRAWGSHVAEWMKKSKLLTIIIRPIVKSWMYGGTIGGAINFVGTKFCESIGKRIKHG